MVVCLRLEIDDAFESDLETLKYIVYQGIYPFMNLIYRQVEILF
jgi:hypothetical protein